MIQLSNVSKSLGRFKALDDVSLTVDSGICYGLLGSNGAGKSTILRLMSGVYLPDGVSPASLYTGEGNLGGAFAASTVYSVEPPPETLKPAETVDYTTEVEPLPVAVNGESPYENPSVKADIFFVSDESSQFQKYTLGELRRFYKFYYPKFDSAKYVKLCKYVDLPFGEKLAKFSKGMKRRAILIAALATRPKYLLLDEAFDGIDPTMRIIMKQIDIDEMLDTGLTTVMSSHNLSETDDFCDRAGLLHKGKLIFDRNLDEVKDGIVKVQCAFDTAAVPPSFTAGACLDSSNKLGIMHAEKQGSLQYIIVRGAAAEVREALAEYSPVLLDIVPLTLEEIFIYEMELLGYSAAGLTETAAAAAANATTAANANEVA